MKNYYKIHEISKLYNIGHDSLRYYEKLGILKPRRDTNGYRMYSLKDIYKLNIIRNLRSLDFSMAQIKDYLDGQSVENTLELFRQEETLLARRIQELRHRKRVIQNRIANLEAALDIPENTICIKTFPDRFCVQLSEYITRDEEMDFLIQKLHKKHETKICDFGDQTIGAFFSVEDIKQGISNVYTSVFFVLSEKTPDYDFILPSGSYLTCCYRGDYTQNASQIQNLLDYAKKNNLSLSDRPFETYEIDNRDTIRPEEFLTEIQVRIL